MNAETPVLTTWLLLLEGRAIPADWVSFGKVSPNTPNHVKQQIKRNPYSSAPHFTSN